MAYFFLVALAIFTIVSGALTKVTDEPTCSDRQKDNHTLRLFINSRKDSDGEWVTTYQATNQGSKVKNITLDLKQSSYICEGNEAVTLMGMIRANQIDNHDQLMFHPKCGKNAAISNDGRSVQKIKLDDPINGVVLTHRPLRRNEMMEVRFDKKLSLHSWNLGIGVTSYTPDSFDIPEHMYRLKSGNWMMYHAKMHVHGALTIENYGKSIDDLKEGDRVGVMVNKNGAMHFFINGEDQGPAASNLPELLYGVVELSRIAKVTLVD